MTADIIQKYSIISTKGLKRKAIYIFNAWIRNRDKDLMCISCNKAPVKEAGHFYSAGFHPWIRFHEHNAN